MRKYLGPEEIIRKKSEYMIPCVYHFYKKPMQLVRGQMQYLYDHTGKKYLDCFAGVSVMNCGHCHPEITERIVEQTQTLQHTCTIYLTEPIVNLAERLAQVTPGDLKKSFFCSSGTEANEGAILLASLHTNSHEFISLYDGLYGRTKLTMSLTGIGMWRTDSTPVGGIHFVPNAYCYRCPLGKRYPECDLACANEVEQVIQKATSGHVAAMITETIQGNAGIITPPSGYFRRLKEILEHHKILLIVDEVQTGFGRTGKMFAIEHYEVTPDIMTMAKALGNGAPISAFMTNDKVAASYTKPGASTLGGNPVSALAGLATLDVLEKYSLVPKAASLGLYLKNSLLELKKKYSIIGDVRGKGLMLGVELVRSDKSPDPESVDIVLEKMKDRGYLLGKNGVYRNVLALQPPLVITQEDVAEMLNDLEVVLKDICRRG